MNALEEVRNELVPATVGSVPGVAANVTGDAAASVDFRDQLDSRLPWIFAFVFGLAFILMTATFRSVVISLNAIVLNLLSVGAAYGVLVLVFQDGHGEGLLGFASNGGVASWLPLFLFVILFGLSMDYHVFILSRVKEAYDGGMSSGEAVRHSIASTAGTVTCAAAVMVGVFLVFATLEFIEFKEMGVGLAVAVLIDATIIRGVLLPASMKLLGDWNWYMPSWLEWLPHVGGEGWTRRRSPNRAAGPRRSQSRDRLRSTDAAAFPGLALGCMAVAIPIAGLIGGAISGPVDAPAAAFIGGALTGAGLGTAQWLAAKDAFGDGRVWIAITAFGYGAGLVVGAAVVDYDTDMPHSPRWVQSAERFSALRKASPLPSRVVEDSPSRGAPRCRSARPRLGGVHDDRRRCGPAVHSLWSMGAIVFMLLSGLLLARFSPAARAA